MKEQIIKILGGGADVENFAAYIQRLILEMKDGKLKNTFVQNRSAEEFATLYRRVEASGLVFDGKHVTLQSTGITYDYVAYKNKMLLAYPETLIDMNVVLIGDTFTCEKQNGQVNYTHTIFSPFGANGSDETIGAYCVIKNSRGEFLTTLGKDELMKHRKVAKTDFIWREWFKEMALKTVIKKACKQHFDDIYEKVEEIDNENYDLGMQNVEDDVITLMKEVDALKTYDEVVAFYASNKGHGKEFDAYVAEKAKALKNANS